MKYYRIKVTLLYDDEEYTAVGGYDKELSKKDLVVLDWDRTYVVGRVAEVVDEMEVLTGKVSVKNILSKVDIKEYEASKEALVKRTMLLNEMENLCKEVKLVENLKKFSGHDERMSKLMEKYEELGK